MKEQVNHPAHYTSHPSGVECIEITQHMGFCLGNALKYIWRADLKGNSIQDLKKAQWYLAQEIALREARAEVATERRRLNACLSPWPGEEDYASNGADTREHTSHDEPDRHWIPDSLGG